MEEEEENLRGKSRRKERKVYQSMSTEEGRTLPLKTKKKTEDKTPILICQSNLETSVIARVVWL